MDFLSSRSALRARWELTPWPRVRTPAAYDVTNQTYPCSFLYFDTNCCCCCETLPARAIGGRVSEQGMATCSPCGKGEFMNVTGSAAACHLCAAGSSQLMEGQPSCQLCPGGFYSVRC
eukprot:1174185-Prorocentrum_minimum.AAC.6